MARNGPDHRPRAERRMGRSRVVRRIGWLTAGVLAGVVAGFAVGLAKPRVRTV